MVTTRYVSNGVSSFSWHLNPLIREGGRSLVPFVFCLLGFLLPAEWRKYFFNLSLLLMWFIFKEIQIDFFHLDLTVRAISVATTATSMTLSTLATIAPVKDRKKSQCENIFMPRKHRRCKIEKCTLFGVKWLVFNMCTHQHSCLSRLLQVHPHLHHLKLFTQKH